MELAKRVGERHLAVVAPVAGGAAVTASNRVATVGNLWSDAKQRKQPLVRARGFGGLGGKGFRVGWGVGRASAWLGVGASKVVSCEQRGVCAGAVAT